jgi:YqcI/YcgG family
MRINTGKELGIAYLSRSEVADNFPAGSWQRVIFSEFGATLASEVRPFPCIFGVQGFEGDQLRYLFMDDVDEKVLGVQLKTYLTQARGSVKTHLLSFSVALGRLNRWKIAARNFGASFADYLKRKMLFGQMEFPKKPKIIDGSSATRANLFLLFATLPRTCCGKVGAPVCSC